MSKSIRGSRSFLPGQAGRLEPVCERFEEAWLAGERPLLEEFVSRVDEVDQPALLRELLALDVEYRNRNGEQVSAEDYRRRLPRHASIIESELQHFLPAVTPGNGKDSTAMASTAVGEGATAPSPLANETPSVAGYEVVGELGHGGMGVVYKARHLLLQRLVALKLLRLDYRGLSEMETRFLEEAQLTGQLQHPGVPPVHEVGVLADGRPFLAMKLIEGRTLAELLQERPTPTADLPRFLAIFEQICQTLAYAHARGVIHRDLKPGNIMVGAFGEVQVMDWGLAKVLHADEFPTAKSELEAGRLVTVRTTSPGLSSQAGAVMGTPAFMAPEQARGEVDHLDERCDVFGLGAILCVVVTGQPPYLGAADEVVSRAARGELADALARLDASGVDDQLIQLARACLAAPKEDRPRHAGEVSQIIGSYLTGVRERLRQAELERAQAEVRAMGERRRRRLAVGLAASLLALVCVGSLGGLYLQQQASRIALQEAERRLDVEAALAKVSSLNEREHWSEARLVLEQAQAHLADSVPGELRLRLQQARNNLVLVDRLDDIHQKRTLFVEGKFDSRSALRDYPVAFQEGGLGHVDEDESAVAARIRASPIQVPLIAALDDWASIMPKEETRVFEWLLGVARRADPHDWRNRFRDPNVRRDRAALERLASDLVNDETRLRAQSPRLLAALATSLYERQLNSTPLLIEARRRYPNDFWLNLQLGNVLLQSKQWDEATGYYRAALAVRPDSEAVYHNLGEALRSSGRLDDAIKEFRAAIEINSKYANAHTGLARILSDKGQLNEAIQECRAAVKWEPKSARAHSALGAALITNMQVDEAIKVSRTAIALDPNLSDAYSNLGFALLEKGDPKGAVEACRKAVDLNGEDAKAFNNLGRALHASGQFDKAVTAFNKAIELEPRWANAYNSLGVTLVAKGDLDGGEKAFRRAIACDSTLINGYNNLVLALFYKGDLKGAIKACRTAIGLAPRRHDLHIQLGQMLLQQGHYVQARTEVKRGIDLLAPNDGLRSMPSDLLKQCNGQVALLEEKLPDVLKGTAKPRDVIERLNLAELCRTKQQYVESVRLYGEAFASDAKLPDDMEHRYNAACAAALAACEKSKPDGKLNENERARLHKQAQNWLRQDLALWAKEVQNDTPTARETIQKTLRHWQSDPELIDVRDQNALQKLPGEERKQWQQLWSDVAAVLLQVERK